MAVTVTNKMLDAVDSIVERESIGVAPYRTRLLVEFDAAGGLTQEIIFPQNPEGYELGYGSRWQARRASSVAQDVSDFEGHDPTSLSFSVLLYAGDDPATLEQEFLYQLELAAQLILPETLEGPRAAIFFGSYYFRGHVSRLRVHRKRTDYRGYATVAKVQLEMTRNDNT